MILPDTTGILISIHALREEGDPSPTCKGESHNNFYPRPPRGGRRERKTVADAPSDFYPRPPRGGRHVLVDGEFQMDKFLSTPSARRATPKED